jgi:hypothetical protein
MIMKTPMLHSLLGVSLVAAACLFSGHPTVAAEKVSARTVTPTVPKASTRSTSIISNDIPVIEVPPSLFVANFQDSSGTDPFFPNAQYIRNSRKRAEPVITAKPGPGDDAPLKALKVTGVGGIGDKRWAMLNGVTIYVGENATFQVNGKAEKIECLEISNTAVTVGIKGTETRREIKLN